MMNLDEAVDEGRKMLRDNGSIDDVLSLWRTNGLTILHSIQALRHLTDRSLTNAKEVVHNSQTWSDLREANDRFHNELERLAENSDDDE